MKFLIVGDLHGQKPNIYFEDFDAIIAPGDFCSSDAIRPLMFQALKERLKDPKSKVQWYDSIGKREARKLIQQSITDGRSILKFLDSFDVPVYFVPGNNDWTPEKDAKWDFLKQNHYGRLILGLEHLVDVHHRLVDAGECQIIGHGLSSGPEYPQYKQDIDALTAKKLGERRREYQRDLGKVSKLFDRATKPIVFLSHNVPFNTPIDAINNQQSPRNGQHFGSLVARVAIDKYHPLICFGGHMHEHFAQCKLGKTVCVNVGYGSNVNTILEIKDGKISRLQLYKD